MKEAIKNVWRWREPESRVGLDIAYLHLSQFQDGIGDAILDCKISGDAASRITEIARPNSPFQQWLAWEKVSMAEMEILMVEWEEFERSNGKTVEPAAR